MNKYIKIYTAILIILNAVVLMGQLWPKGAPPFAATVNILTLILNMIFLLALLLRKK